MHIRRAALTLLMTLALPEFAFADAPVVKPDLSHTLIIVDVADQFPASQKKEAHPLENLAGISPRTAKQAVVVALSESRNLPHTPGSYAVTIEAEKDPKTALADAEKDGVGTVVVLTIVQRSIGDIGTSEHRLYTDVLMSMRNGPNNSWRKLVSKRVTTTTAKEREADDYRPEDTDMMVRQVSAMIDAAMKANVTPVRFKGTRKDEAGATILMMSVTNNAGRDLKSLQLALPMRGEDPLTLTCETPVPAGQTLVVGFSPVAPAPAAKAVWTQAQISNVLFDGEDPTDRDPFNSFRQRMKLLQKLGGG